MIVKNAASKNAARGPGQPRKFDEPSKLTIMMEGSLMELLDDWAELSGMRRSDAARLAIERLVKTKPRRREKAPEVGTS